MTLFKNTEEGNNEQDVKLDAIESEALWITLFGNARKQVQRDSRQSTQ